MQVVHDEVGSALPADRMRPRSAPGPYTSPPRWSYSQRCSRSFDWLPRRQPEFEQVGDDVIIGSTRWLAVDGRAQERYQVITLRDGKIAAMQGSAFRRQIHCTVWGFRREASILRETAPGAAETVAAWSPA